MRKNRKTKNGVNFSPLTASSRLSDKKKRELFVLFDQYGMSQTVAFYRLSFAGFKEWERKGISALIADFKGEKVGILDVSKFYESLPRKEDFIEFMVKKGISRATIIKKMKTQLILPWEWVGIDKIVENFNQKP